MKKTVILSLAVVAAFYAGQASACTTGQSTSCERSGQTNPKKKVMSADAKKKYVEAMAGRVSK